MPSIKIGDIILSTGMTVRANEHAEDHEVAPEGIKPIIYRITKDASGPVIGLYNQGGKIRDHGWHDFDGEVESQRGTWISLEIFLKCFDLACSNIEIVADLIFKGRNLKGMRGKVVASGELIFVELDEDVGGCSADGLGKAGHCIAVSSKEAKLTTNFRSLRGLEFEKFV